MKGANGRVTKGKISETVSSRIKNPELVRKKHLLIAKKASKLFMKKGYHQTTMREISKATGMAIGNLYDYISKKEDVLCLVFDAYHQHVQDNLDKSKISEIANPKEQLKSFIHNSLQNVQNFKDEIALMYRESRLLPRQNLEKAMQREVTQIQVLEKIIKNGIDLGVFHVKDPFFAASMIFYQSVFATQRGWTFKGKYSDEELTDLIAEYVIETIIDP